MHGVIPKTLVGRNTSTLTLNVCTCNRSLSCNFTFRLLKADVLVIDEISMISSYTLDVIHNLLQHTRKNKLIMGGIQRVFCGDFLQLPPIPNQASDDIGQPAILSDTFIHYAPHKVMLNQVRIQDT